MFPNSSNLLLLLLVFIVPISSSIPVEPIFWSIPVEHNSNDGGNVYASFFDDIAIDSSIVEEKANDVVDANKKGLCFYYLPNR
jgi:hypothetical protein